MERLRKFCSAVTVEAVLEFDVHCPRERTVAEQELRVPPDNLHAWQILKGVTNLQCFSLAETQISHSWQEVKLRPQQASLSFFVARLPVRNEVVEA